MREALELLSKYGVSLVTLVVVCVVVLAAWKGVWPLIKARFELADKILADNANRTQSLLETTLKEFENQLKESNRVSMKIADHLEALTDEIRRRPNTRR